MPPIARSGAFANAQPTRRYVSARAGVGGVGGLTVIGHGRYATG